MKVRRNVRVILRSLEGASLRTAEFEGREHLVVPCVALMEGVIHAVNAEAAELVLASELSKAPSGWNGRPVMMDHPSMNGAQISANDPRVLELWKIGTVFGSRMEGDALFVEAWLDKSREEAVAGFPDVLSRVAAGETLEVSVGALVLTDKVSGVDANGNRYAAVWREIVPDHLAILPPNVRGACSVEMGCGAGALVTAAAYEFTTGGVVVVRTQAKKGEVMKLRDRMLAFVRSEVRDAAEGESTSDNELRWRIGDALRASVPGYAYVDSVYPDENLVVYCVDLEGYRTFRATYTLAEGGDVTVGEAIEVEPVTTFKPVAAAGVEAPEPEPASTPATPKAASSCACGGPAPTIARANQEEVMEKNKAIEKILARKGNAFTKAELEACSDAIVEKIAADEPEVVPAAAAPVVAPVATPAAEAEPLTKEKVLAAFPELADAVNEQQSRKAARRKDLVAGIVAAASFKHYTAADLEAMADADLEKLATAAAVKPSIDFGATGVPRAASGADRITPVMTHDDMNAKIRAAQDRAPVVAPKAN